MKRDVKATADERDVLVAIVDGEVWNRPEPILVVMRRSSNEDGGRRQKMINCSSCG